MSNIVKDWDVTWIKVARVDNSFCVRFSSESMNLERTGTFSSHDEVLKREHSRNHLVIIDGYIAETPRLDQLLADCKTWWSENRKKRMLIVVSSMGGTGKISADTKDLYGIRLHPVFSWTLEEYLEATENDVFFNEIQGKLDANIKLRGEKHVDKQKKEDVKVDLVKAKYHFAGGCCRYMFRYSSVECIESISEAVDRIDNFELLISVYWKSRQSDCQCNPGVSTNRSQRQNRQEFHHKRICILCSKKLGSDAILTYARGLSGSNNQMGWVFECSFLLYFKQLLELNCINQAMTSKV